MNQLHPDWLLEMLRKKETRHIELNPEFWNTYQIRLHQVSEIEWLGTVSMDGTEMCQMMMPALGPMEIQVWSDNYLVDTNANDGGRSHRYLDWISRMARTRNFILTTSGSFRRSPS